MAARKNYVRSKNKRKHLPQTPEYERACFLEDMLDGTITGVDDVQEVRDGQGRLVRLTYQDRNG